MCLKTEETAETIRRFLTNDNILEEPASISGFPIMYYSTVVKRGKDFIRNHSKQFFKSNSNFFNPERILA